MRPPCSPDLSSSSEGRGGLLVLPVPAFTGTYLDPPDYHPGRGNPVQPATGRSASLEGSSTFPPSRTTTASSWNNQQMLPLRLGSQQRRIFDPRRQDHLKIFNGRATDLADGRRQSRDWRWTEGFADVGLLSSCPRAASGRGVGPRCGHAWMRRCAASAARSGTVRSKVSEGSGSPSPGRWI